MTRCIFCKTDSAKSTFVEHILPESLGNHDIVLPKGMVCDQCNNYFSKEIESPVLNSGIIRAIRNSLQIPSKKGRIPTTPSPEVPNVTSYRTMGRFLGKVGLEFFAERAYAVPDWERDVIDKPELDPLRNYVRFNKSSVDWGFSFRTLHPVNAVFFDGKEYYELLNELDLFYTERNELYIILSLFGVEFALNLSGPEIDGYMSWLSANHGRSPLYLDKNK
jgi:hypothetical protein